VSCNALLEVKRAARVPRSSGCRGATAQAGIVEALPNCCTMLRTAEQRPPKAISGWLHLDGGGIVYQVEENTTLWHTHTLTTAHAGIPTSFICASTNQEASAAARTRPADARATVPPLRCPNRTHRMIPEAIVSFLGADLRPTGRFPKPGDASPRTILPPLSSARHKMLALHLREDQRCTNDLPACRSK